MATEVHPPRGTPSLLAVRASRLGWAGCGGRGGCRNQPALALGGARALRPPIMAARAFPSVSCRLERVWAAE